MRILIDLQPLQTGSRFRGIGVCATGLIKQIGVLNKKHEILVLLNDYDGQLLDEIGEWLLEYVDKKNIKIFKCLENTVEIFPENKHVIYISELLRESFVSSLRPDFVLVISLFEGAQENYVCSINANLPYKTGVIGHDLIPLMDESRYLPSKEMKQWYYRKIESLRNADFIYTISNSAKKEFSDLLGIEDSKLINISSACLTDFRKLPKKLLNKKLKSKYKINGEFILYSGAADERKNLKGLINAFAKLENKNYQLMLVGKYSDAERALLQLEAQSLGLKNDVIRFAGFISTEDLVQLYNQCKVFIFPSFHEGFGLPVLEAMKCGAVTIASNVTSLPEIIGLQDAMFDPYDIDDIAKKLSLSLEDKKYINMLQENARYRSLLFEESRPVETLLSHIEKLDKANNNSFSEDYNYNNLLSKIASIINSYNISDDIIRNVAKCISANQSYLNTLWGEQEKKLFVDISELVQKDAKTGIQRVTRSILRNLLECSPRGYRVEPVYADESAQGYVYARRFVSKILGITDDSAEDCAIEYDTGDIFLGLDYQTNVVIFQQKTLEKICRSGVSVFFVVHDLLPFYFPQYCIDGVRPVFSKWLEVISQFTGCLCVSSTTAEYLRRWQQENLKCPPSFEQVAFFHNGSDIENSVPSMGIPKDAKKVLDIISQNITVLMVSTVEPRKKYEQTLDAFDLLWENNIDINLVIVGKQGWKVDDLAGRIDKHQENGKRFFWLQGISDEYLQKVYEASTVCLMASLAEGFGLMLIEAARYGKPLIVRDIAIFREIAGDHAHYFTGLDGKDLAESIQNWLELYKLGQHPSTKGMKTLTWQESTQMLLDAMFGILDKDLGDKDTSR